MSLAPPDPTKHVVDPREFMGIRAGYADLFGATTTWADLEKDLSQYTLGEVLDVVGRISAVLKNSTLGELQTQAQLVTGLFRERAAHLLEKADRLGAAAGNPRVVFFEPLQLASLAKAALLLLPEQGDLRADVDLAPLATALLRMTDLIGPTQQFGTFDTEEGRRAWATYLFATGAFYRGGWDLHDLARFRLLCLDRHEVLASYPDYIDLPAQLEITTGLPVHLLWLGITALQSQWLSLDPERAAAGPVFIDEASFLAANFHFSQAEQDRILSIACIDAAAMQELVRAQYRSDDFRPYDLLPLAEKPLVRIGKKVFCVSVPLLMAKLSTGLYYLLANSLKEDERDRFTRFLGAVFEEYVEGLLTRMFASGGVVLGGEALQAAAKAHSKRSSKLADFVLFLDGIVVVVETKARYFPRAARAGRSWADLSSRLQDIYSRGARQLEGAIELCESGALRDLGIDPTNVGAYVPLLVTLDETPLLPPVYDFVTPVRPKSGADKTVPLQVVGVSELEPLEAAAVAGKLNVHALLGHKGTSGRQAETLRNTVLRDPALRALSTRNPLLERVYGAAMTDALQILRVRAR